MEDRYHAGYDIYSLGACLLEVGPGESLIVLDDENEWNPYKLFHEEATENATHFPLDPRYILDRWNDPRYLRSPAKPVRIHPQFSPKVDGSRNRKIGIYPIELSRQSPAPKFVVEISE